MNHDTRKYSDLSRETSNWYNVPVIYLSIFLFFFFKYDIINYNSWMFIQSKELCALHALNNLFQSKEAFKQMELDAICFSLSPNNYINPHRSILGLGNYDVNVLIAALQNKGYSAFWFDKRKSVPIINRYNHASTFFHLKNYVIKLSVYK